MPFFRSGARLVFKERALSGAVLQQLNIFPFLLRAY
jgi:hypothetical protein